MGAARVPQHERCVELPRRRRRHVIPSARVVLGDCSRVPAPAGSRRCYRNHMRREGRHQHTSRPAPRRAGWRGSPGAPPCALQGQGQGAVGMPRHAAAAWPEAGLNRRPRPVGLSAAGQRARPAGASPVYHSLSLDSLGWGWALAPRACPKREGPSLPSRGPRLRASCRPPTAIGAMALLAASIGLCGWWLAARSRVVSSRVLFRNAAASCTRFRVYEIVLQRCMHAGARFDVA